MIGDILAVRSNKFYGKIITFFLHTKVNHIALQITSTQALEMAPSGPRIVSLDTLYPFVRVRPPMAPRNKRYAAVEKIKRRYLGKGIKYSWGQAIAIGLKRVFGIHVGWHAGSICSELGAEYANFVADLHIDDDDIAPDRLVDVLVENGWFIISGRKY